MYKAALCVLYNTSDISSLHRIKFLYGKNFEHIYHIVPLFPEVDKKDNIINVFENKFQMSGYIPQALDAIQTEDVTHYMFMIETCPLSPYFKDDEIDKYFGVDNETSYIHAPIFPVTYEVIKKYRWAFSSIYNFQLAANGAEVRKLMPLKPEARDYYKKFGIKAPFIYTEYLTYLIENLVIGSKQTHEFYLTTERGEKNISNLTDAFTYKTEKEKLATIFPLVASLSEFFIIPKKTLKDFATYCGMFAAARLHYNIGFANSLCFSADKIKTSKDVGKKAVNRK